MSVLGPWSAPESWLVFGASGLLGHGVSAHLAATGRRVTAAVHRHTLAVPGIQEVSLDLLAGDDATGLPDATAADVILYAAGLTSVDRCEEDEQLALSLHAEMPARLATRAAALGRRFVYISTDHLWDGAHALVREDEPPRPINAYARTKAAGERMVAAADPSALILRTNFFGNGRPWRQSLSDWMLSRLRSGQTLNAFGDAFFTPIGIPLLTQLIDRAVAAGLQGIYHVCGGQRISKYEFALHLASWCGLPGDLVRRGRLADAGLLAPRPADMSLATDKIAAALHIRPPGLEESFAAVLGPRAIRPTRD